MLTVGCGGSNTPELGQVSGVVTKAGQPVANAWVEFRPETGRPSVARTDADGRYTLSYIGDTMGAVCGNHLIKVGTGGVPEPDGRNETPRVQLGEDLEFAVFPGVNTIDVQIP